MVVGRFFNKWFKARIRKGRKERLAFEDIVESLRKHWFSGRANLGPEWEGMESFLAPALTEEGLKLLKEMITEGADPVYMDLHGGEGYVGKSKTMDAKVIKKLLADQFAELYARRALLFDMAEPGMRDLLVRAGVHVSPIVTAYKTDAAGRDRLDEDNEVMVRICTNCKDAKHSHAANTGIRSSEHTSQKTTSPAQVAFRL